MFCAVALLLSYQRGLAYVDVKEVQHCVQSCREMLGIHDTIKRKKRSNSRLIRAIQVLLTFSVGVCCGFIYNGPVHRLLLGM